MKTLPEMYLSTTISSLNFESRMDLDPYPVDVSAKFLPSYNPANRKIQLIFG